MRHLLDGGDCFHPRSGPDINDNVMRRFLRYKIHYHGYKYVFVPELHRICYRISLHQTLPQLLTSKYYELALYFNKDSAIYPCQWT